MLVGASVQLALSVGRGEPLAAVDLTLEVALAFLYLAVFAGALGFIIYFRLIEPIGALHVNTMLYLTPVEAMGVGRAFLGEPIQAASVAGLGIILAGFLLLEEHEIVAELARFRGAGR